MLIPRDLFAYIRLIYTQAGMKPADVAKKVGISQAHYSQIEKCTQRCPLPTFLSICRAVEVNLCEFEDVETVEKSLVKMKSNQAALEKIKKFNKQIQELEDARDLLLDTDGKAAEAE